MKKLFKFENEGIIEWGPWFWCQSACWLFDSCRRRRRLSRRHLDHISTKLVSGHLLNTDWPNSLRAEPNWPRSVRRPVVRLTCVHSANQQADSLVEAYNLGALREDRKTIESCPNMTAIGNRSEWVSIYLAVSKPHNCQNKTREKMPFLRTRNYVHKSTGCMHGLVVFKCQVFEWTCLNKLHLVVEVNLDVVAWFPGTHTHTQCHKLELKPSCKSIITEAPNPPWYTRQLVWWISPRSHV